jgi:GNAT superfamily N-acetyltransferase
MTDSPRPNIAYRPMTAADAGAAHALSVALKWPHREADWAMLQRLSEGVVAEHDGRLIGSAFACHQGDFSTIGLVIVSDDHQGQGIGRQLMERALACAAPRTAILNATLAGAPLYAKMGFRDFGQIEQRQGQTPAAIEPAPSPAGDPCRALGDSDAAQVRALANAGSGLRRDAVIDDQLAVASHAIGIERAGQLRGFALLRPFGRGLCLGPVIAEDLDQAKHLIASLLGQVPEAFVRIDVPVGGGLGDWLQALGLNRVDVVTQMSLGAVPTASQGVRQFALVTQAIG